jgi:hypothetical protein
VEAEAEAVEGACREGRVWRVCWARGGGQAVGVSTTEPCEFKNLSMLVFVCHCLLPLLSVPLVFLLIPNKLMTESLDEAAPETAAEEVVAERPHSA